jgi:hypothetical protein
MNKKPPETGAFLLGQTLRRHSTVNIKTHTVFSEDLVRLAELTALLLRRGFFIKTKPRFRIAEAEDFYPAHFVQAQWASIKIPDPLRGSGLSAPSRI